MLVNYFLLYNIYQGFVYTYYIVYILDVNRTMDAEIIDRIKMHIRDINFSLLIPHECKKNITLADYFYQMEKYFYFFKLIYKFYVSLLNFQFF